MGNAGSIPSNVTYHFVGFGGLRRHLPEPHNLEALSLEPCLSASPQTLKPETLKPETLKP